MKDSKLYTYVGFVSALITIIDCTVRTLKSSKLTVSPISIIGLTILVVTIIVYFFSKDVIVLYNIKKRLCYFIRNKDSYWVENKECIYVYITRTELEHTKKHDIISNVSNLKCFCDKFKWSKEQKVEEIDIKSNNPNHQVSVKRIENWHQYTVNFDELGKGQKESISITISNLHDPNKEALPFLSSNIICRTKRLRLVVSFKDASLHPIDIKFKIFDNYASDFPLFQKELNYDKTEQKVEIIEKMPIYGYRYEITWKFEND